ncbi:unnamed protein product [Blepharisma stoltei]|uniref:Uncharacterized protein n=1 Tax=Blepharisma stoltei TaxID=1481888 RepID=A0AAU9J070_9CILI|nr:unnamed protein product [Blepharisma stoltei]
MQKPKTPLQVLTNSLKVLNLEQPVYRALAARLEQAKHNATKRITILTRKYRIVTPDHQQSQSENLLSEDVSFRLQHRKLEEAKTKKKHLKSQLKLLDDSISFLEQSLPSHQSHKKLINESEEEHQQKVKKFKELTKRLNEEKLKRKIVIEKLEAQRQEKLIKEAEELMLAKQEMEEEARILKQKKLEELKIKAQERKENIKEMRKFLKESSQKSFEKPTFQVLEEKFKTNIELPELEKRKTELAKIHLLYRPLSHDDLECHAQKLEEIHKEAEKRREKEKSEKKTDEKIDAATIAQLQTTSLIKAIEQQKKEKLEKDREAYEKKIMSQKQRNYAEIVKEMFTPVIDMKKRYELLMKIEKRKKGNIIKQEKLKVNRSLSVIRQDTEIHSQKRHSQAKSVVPEIKNKAKIVDYLAERRKYRSNISVEYPIGEKANINWDYEMEKGIKNIQDQASHIEKLARKREIIAKSITPLYSQAINLEEQVNDMLIESVRAKMKLLSNQS